MRTRDGKTYYVMADVDGVPRRRRPSCSPRCSASRRKATTPAAKKLFDTYGVHFDPKLRDEVVARVEQAELPSYTGFVMPKLDAVTNARRRDHRRHVSYPQDLTRRCSTTRAPPATCGASAI